MKFTEEDPDGHPYHSLAYGDPDGPDGEVLFVDYLRMDPPLDGDEYVARFKMHGMQVVIPRTILMTAIYEGWNYTFSSHKFICDHEHQLYEPPEMGP